VRHATRGLQEGEAPREGSRGSHPLHAWQGAGPLQHTQECSGSSTSCVSWAAWGWCTLLNAFGMSDNSPARSSPAHLSSETLQGVSLALHLVAAAWRGVAGPPAAPSTCGAAKLQLVEYLLVGVERGLLSGKIQGGASTSTPRAAG
jgi:hypothetical protein